MSVDYIGWVNAALRAWADKNGSAQIIRVGGVMHIVRDGKTVAEVRVSVRD